MTKDEKTKILEQLSDVAIAGLKKSVADGQKPTRESLMEILNGMNETHAFIESITGETSGKKSHIKDIELLKNQKKKLVQQLDGMEEQFDRNERLAKRIMVFFTEWMRPFAGESLDKSLSQFKQILKERSDPDLIEETFNQLKTQAMRGEVASGDKEEKPKKSLMSRLISKESVSDVQERYIEQFRSTYRDVINELGLDLSMEFLPRLLQVGKQINSSETFDDFSGLRKDLLDLLHDYIESVTRDREKTAEFIREIGQKLAEVEKDLIRAFGLTEDIFTDNHQFGDNLLDELNDLEQTVGYSQKIDELKEAVSSKLAQIKSAVMKKKENDVSLKSGLDEGIHSLQAEFEGLKQEALAARAQAEQLEKEIFTDTLTGSLNRRAYERRIQDEFNRYMRYKRPFSMLLFDVDHFKKVNDTYGHATGDTVLQEIIKRATPMIRECDMLARYGGEEFIIILPETPSQGAGQVGEKIRKAIENIEFIHRDQTLHVTISVGVTEAGSGDKTHMDLFNRMDRALYDAKNSGRNKVVIR